MQPGDIVDRYTIERVLGEGGMAIVYKARHNQLGSEHAIKVLTLPHKSLRRRLVAEGQAQSTLRHPNIVSVTDVLDTEAGPALVMEFIEGPSLDDLLARQRLTVEQADLLASGILKGVAAAHRRGFVHRDLKPANVMLQLVDEHLIPKVADFGIVKTLESEGDAPKTKAGIAMGTPQYMAPEQIRDAGGVDARADVWSLGCILYEMVTGRRAFDGEDTLDLFAKVGEGRFTPPRTLIPDLPQRMEEAILGAILVDVDARIPDVEHLRQLWEGTDLEATPVPTPWASDLLDPTSWRPEPNADWQTAGTDQTYDFSEPVNPEETGQTVDFATTGSESSSETLLPTAEPSEDTEPPEETEPERPAALPAPSLPAEPAPPAGGVSPLVLAAGAFAVLVPVLGVGIGVMAFQGGNPEPAPQAAPAPAAAPSPAPAAAPSPAPDPIEQPRQKQKQKQKAKTKQKPRQPAPTATNPQPAPAPVAPASVAPAPTAEPEPQPVAAPAPQPVPEPAPQPAVATYPITFGAKGAPAEVFIDGESIGTTPKLNVPIPAGRHTLTFVAGASRYQGEIVVGNRGATRYIWPGSGKPEAY